MTGHDLEATQAAFDEAFRHDAGRSIGEWFTADGQLLWPEMAAIVGREAIGQAFADFAAAFETIAFEPTYDLVDVSPPVAVVMGTFVETRRSRDTSTLERVHGRVGFAWQLGADGWCCARLMTSRYAPTEVLT